MAFNLIRFVTTAAVLFFAFFTIKKGKIEKRSKKAICLLAVGFAAIVLACFFPPEDLLVNFRSPEEAFRYTYFNKVEYICEGDDAAFVLYKDYSDNAFTIIPKSKNGWKIGQSYKSKMDVYYLSNTDYIVVMYNYKNTDTYFVEVVPIIEDPIGSMTDTLGSTFDVYGEGLGTSYFCCIDSLPEDYGIIIDGKTYRISA